MIKVLNSLDIPIRDIKEFANDRSPERILTLLTEHENILKEKINSITRSYDIIRTFRTLINTGLAVEEDVIGVSHLDEALLTIGDENNFSGNQYFYDAFIEFCNKADTLHIDLNYPIGGLFTDMHAFVKTPGKPTRFFSIAPNGNFVRPAGDYLIGYNRGYYGETGNLATKIVEYAKEHRLNFFGPVYNIFLHDEICIKNPSEYLLQFSVQIRSAE